MHLKLISCELYEREIEAAVARSHNQVETEFLPASSHQLPPSQLLSRYQGLVDAAATTNFHAVLFATGACKRHLAGLKARSIPLVIPRAKDCISLVLPRSFGPTPILPNHPVSLHRRPMAAAPRAAGRPRAQAGFWMAPVHDFASSRSEPNLTRFEPVAPSRAPERAVGVLPKTASRRPARSILDMLVEGYWSYPDFLVVLPGWQIALADDNGSLSATETL